GDMPRRAPERQITVANVSALPQLQRLCDTYGVRPTYLTTYAVATDPAAARTLAGVQATGRCEIGAHLHPWNTPPQPDGPRLDAVRATQIPVDAMIAKKRMLTNTLEQVFDRRPRSFRAGRFGINGLCLQALEALGYAVDSSVITGVSLAGEGGEDFRRAPDRPYFPDRRDPARVGTCTVYEVPVSAGFTREVGARTRRLYDAILPWTRLRGLLSDDHLGILDHHWLYPTLVKDAALVRVADVLLERGVPVLNIFLHSSELLAGASPYSK